MRFRGRSLRGEPLAHKVGADERLLGECAIGLEDARDRLAQIVACLVDRLALRVGARELFDEGDMPPWGSLRNTAVRSSDMEPPQARRCVNDRLRMRCTPSLVPSRSRLRTAAT